jgi:hypothetical protein
MNGVSMLVASASPPTAQNQSILVNEASLQCYSWKDDTYHTPYCWLVTLRMTYSLRSQSPRSRLEVRRPTANLFPTAVKVEGREGGGGGGLAQYSCEAIFIFCLDVML